MNEPLTNDAADDLATSTAKIAEDAAKGNDGVIVLVLVRRKDKSYCAEMRSNIMDHRAIVDAVNGWVMRRVSQLFGN